MKLLDITSREKGRKTKEERRDYTPLSATTYVRYIVVPLETPDVAVWQRSVALAQQYRNRIDYRMVACLMTKANKDKDEPLCRSVNGYHQ